MVDVEYKMKDKLLVGKEGLDCCSKRGFTGLYIGSSTLVKQGVKSGDLATDTSLMSARSGVPRVFYR
jgi:hypothetical protein